MTEKLDDDTRTEMLGPLLTNDWSHDPTRDALQKQFVFADFVEAFGWMTRVAIWAEKWNHHPGMGQRLQNGQRDPDNA